MELHGTEQRCYTLAFGIDLIIDPVRHQATLKGESLDLTRKEFDLLFCLALHAGQVLSREQLYSHVWPNDNEFDVDASIKNHITKLRKKLSPGGKEYIENVWASDTVLHRMIRMKYDRNTKLPETCTPAALSILGDKRITKDTKRIRFGYYLLLYFFAWQLVIFK